MFRRLLGSRARRAYEKGIEHYNAGALAEAIEHFDEALRPGGDAHGPDATLAYFYRGQAHARLGAAEFEAGRPREALLHFDAAIADHPTFPDLHLQRGLAQLCLDDPLAAEQSARQALRINDRLIEAGLLAIVALTEQGHTQRAAHERDRWHAVAAESGHPLHPLLQSAMLDRDALLDHRAKQRARRRTIERIDGLLHQGFWKDARDALEELLDHSPDYPDLRLRMAAALTGLHDEELATHELDVALERNPRFGDAHVLAGIVALRRDRVPVARQHFREAERAGQAASPVRYGHALCELRVGDIRAARRRLDAIWAEEEFGTEARFLRAGLVYLDGDVEQALHLYRDALVAATGSDLLIDAAAFGLQTQEYGLVRRAVDALPPGAPDAAAALARAALLGAEGSRDRAIDVLEAATALHPDDPAVLWALARAHAERGETEVALRRLSNLEALGSFVPGAGRLAARLYRESGDFERALHALRIPDGPTSGGPEAGLEELYVLRGMGEADRARQVWQGWAQILPLDPRWRLQDPRRWLTPLPPWPTAASATRSRG